MKSSIWGIIVIILVICISLILWKQHGRVVGSDNDAVTAGQKEALNVSNEQVANVTTTASNQFVVRPGSFPTNVNTLGAAELALWRSPIEFYGKVIDQNSNPVAGASVEFHWVEEPTKAGNKISRGESGPDGLFSLHDAYGPSLSVSVAKDGYYTSRSASDSFRYVGGGFHPDPLNPVIFNLRKKEKGELLVENNFPPGIGQIWQLHHDGTPMNLDLVNGSTDPSGNGQLKLEFWRDISNRKASVFNWKLQLIITAGGIIETSDEFPFEAPETGYEPSVIIDMSATNQQWIGEVRKKYYIRLSDGRYGRIDFYLLPYNGVFIVHSAVNSSGSRNLEPR